jgi:hypothetical protein
MKRRAMIVDGTSPITSYLAFTIDAPTINNPDPSNTAHLRPHQLAAGAAKTAPKAVPQYEIAR